MLYGLTLSPFIWDHQCLGKLNGNIFVPEGPVYIRFFFISVMRLSRRILRIARRSSIYMLQLCFVNFFIEPIGLSCFTTDYFFNLVVPIKSFPVLKLPLTFLNCKVWKDVVWSNPFTLYMRSSVFRKTQWKYFCARRPCIYPIFFYKRDAFVT